MQYYVQCYDMSTGYIKGSCPPMFDDKNKKPIEACGSDGIFFVDGRLKLSNVQRIAKEHCEKHKFIGYRIYKSHHIEPVQDNPNITFV